MRVSVIVATKDRPGLLRRALRSVVSQAGVDVELVLLDGSTCPEGRAGTASVLAELVPSGLPHALQPDAAGPSAARNEGLRHASEGLIAFLDDDDEWLDADYLSRTSGAMQDLGLDLHIADQEAVRPDGIVVPGPVWTEDLGTLLPAAGLQATGGAFVASPVDLLRSNGFAHLNTTMISRRLASEIGGFDPAIPYEEDRDFYLRAIDAAHRIGYTPGVVARHYVPANRPSASGIAQVERDRFRARVLEKALAAHHPAIRARARSDLAYTLRRMAERAANAGDISAARHHAQAALRLRPGPGPLLDLVRLYGRSAAASRSHSS